MSANYVYHFLHTKGVLSVDALYIQTLRFIDLWHKDLLPDVLITSFVSFLTFLITCFSMLVIFMVTTQDTLLKETFVNLNCVRTNIGKQPLSFATIDIWKDLPSSLKDASVFASPK